MNREMFRGDTFQVRVQLEKVISHGRYLEHRLKMIFKKDKVPMGTLGIPSRKTL